MGRVERASRDAATGRAPRPVVAPEAAHPAPRSFRDSGAVMSLQRAAGNGAVTAAVQRDALHDRDRMRARVEQAARADLVTDEGMMRRDMAELHRSTKHRDEVKARPDNLGAVETGFAEERVKKLTDLVVTDEYAIDLNKSNLHEKTSAPPELPDKYDNYHLNPARALGTE